MHSELEMKQSCCRRNDAPGAQNLQQQQTCACVQRSTGDREAHEASPEWVLEAGSCSASIEGLIDCLVLVLV